MKAIKTYNTAAEVRKAISNMVDLFCDFYKTDWYKIDIQYFNDFVKYAKQGDTIAFEILIREHGTDAIFNFSLKDCEENLARLQRSNIRFKVGVLYKEGMFEMQIESI